MFSLLLFFFFFNTRRIYLDIFFKGLGNGSAESGQDSLDKSQDLLTIVLSISVTKDCETNNGCHPLRQTWELVHTEKNALGRTAKPCLTSLQIMTIPAVKKPAFTSGSSAITAYIFYIAG